MSTGLILNQKKLRIIKPVDYGIQLRKPLSKGDLDYIREVFTNNPELSKAFAKLGLKVVSIEKSLESPPI